jgi:hypothetical protein
MQAAEVGSKEKPEQRSAAEVEQNGDSVNVVLNGDGAGAHDSGEDEGEDEGEDGEDEDDDAFTAQEFSIDLNAFSRGAGKNNIIFTGNQMQQPISLSREQVSQLRTAPSGDFVLPGRAPRGATRVKMLPPRARKGARALITADDVPEPNCACGLSRYGVSARPTLTMTTKTAEVEHRCMGRLFEGIDVPHDVTDAIKVRRIKLNLEEGQRPRRRWSTVVWEVRHERRFKTHRWRTAIYHCWPYSDAGGVD